LFSSLLASRGSGLDEGNPFLWEEEQDVSCSVPPVWEALVPHLQEALLSVRVRANLEEEVVPLASLVTLRHLSMSGIREHFSEV
jgi:hypothetical protein